MYFWSWIIALGIVGGWLSGKLMKGNSFGRSMDIVMGLGGAVGVGVTIGSLGVPGLWGFLYATAVALLGATLVTALAAFVHGKKYAYDAPVRCHSYEACGIRSGQLYDFRSERSRC